MSDDPPTPKPSDQTVRLDPAAFASPAPPQIPDHELLRCVGQGAYGEVWLARNVMGTYRAVKVVYRRTFSDQRPYEREFDGIKKFEPISRSQASQVDILHVGRSDAAGYFFYVMELADDERRGTQLNPDDYAPKTLRSEIAHRGRLPFEECLNLALALATALDHLHQNGLMHRDIKPPNIIFVNGQPKLADIGLVTETDSTKSFVGTEGYIPPEGPTTPQADIYSLGKVLYEAATGRDRMDFPELPTLLGNETEREGLIEFNEVILRACETDVRKRYQSAAEMHADLLLLKTGKSVKHTRSLERRLVFLIRIGVTTAVLLALAVGGYYSWTRQNEKALRETARNLEEKGRLYKKLAETESRARKTAEQQLYVQNIAAAQRHYLNNDITRARESLKQCASELRHWEWNYLQRLCNSEVMTLYGHSNTVDCVLYSPNGRFLASSSKDGTIIIWNAELGKEMHRLNGHPDGVNSMAFSPDSSRLANASYVGDEHRISEDGAVNIWEVESGRLLSTFGKSSAREKCVAFSPDGLQLLTGGYDGTITLWDIAMGKSVTSVAAHASPVAAVAFSPHGDLIASGNLGKAEANEVKTWNASLGPLLSFTNLPGVCSLAFSPDQRFLAAAVNEGEWLELDGEYARKGHVVVWDAKAGRGVSKLAPRSGGVAGLAFSPDGKHLAVACGFFMGWSNSKTDSHFSWPGEVVVWKTDNWSVSATLRAHVDDVTAVSFHPDSKHVVSSSLDGTLKIWSIRNARAFEIVPEQPGFKELISSNWAGYSLDLKRVATCDAFGGMKVYDTANGQCSYALKVSTNMSCGTVSFAPDEDRLALFKGRHLIVYDRNSNAATLNFATAEGEHHGSLINITFDDQAIIDAKFSPDGRFIGLQLAYGLQLIDTSTGEKVIPQQNGITSFCLAPDSSHVVIADQGGKIAAWETKSGGLETIYAGGRRDDFFSFVHCVSTAGDLLLSGSADPNRLGNQVLEIWDLQSRKRLRSLAGFGGCAAATFSPDAKRVAALVGRPTSRTLEIKIWDVTTGQELLTIGPFGVTDTGTFNSAEDLVPSPDNAFPFFVAKVFGGRDLSRVRLVFDSNGERLMLPTATGLILVFDSEPRER